MSDYPRRLVTAGVLLACTQTLQGQTIPGEPPSPSECQAAAEALRGGSRDGTGWEALAACGTVGGAALAQALQSARRESDAPYLEVLYGSLSVIRDPQVFRAALTVMQDKEATSAARIVALLTGLAQHDMALRPGLSVPLRSVISGGQSKRCPIALGMIVGDYRSKTALPTDYLAQLSTAVAAASDDIGAQESVRAMARCVQGMLASAAPIRVLRTSIQLVYSCGNRFRVINESKEWIKVTWRIEESGDKGDLVVEPKGHLEFTTRKSGEVTLLYGGAVVATKKNEQRKCTE